MGTCPLCQPDGELILWKDDRLRVILVNDADYPAFCRVIWNAHVKEMTDLADSDAGYMMRAVLASESALRELLRPDKINLASLGNQVPHLHWHVIPRYSDDAHFPDPVWAGRKRQGHPRTVDVQQLRVALNVALGGIHA